MHVPPPPPPIPVYNKVFDARASGLAVSWPGWWRLDIQTATLSLLHACKQMQMQMQMPIYALQFPLAKMNRKKREKKNIIQAHASHRRGRYLVPSLSLPSRTI